jgi:hypothetical protein
MKCEKCGADVQIGQWPFCGGDPSRHVDARSFGDPPMEPYVDEHVAPGGRDVGHDSEGNPYYGHLITTRGERRRLMSRNHSDYHDVSGKRRGGKLYFFVGGK